MPKKSTYPQSPHLAAMLDRERAAAWINRSTRQLDRYVQDGRIRPHYVGGRPMFTRTELDAFIVGGGGRSAQA